MKKKAVTYLLVTALVLSLAGCGGTSQTSEASEAAESAVSEEAAAESVEESKVEEAAEESVEESEVEEAAAESVEESEVEEAAEETAEASEEEVAEELGIEEVSGTLTAALSVRMPSEITTVDVSEIDEEALAEENAPAEEAETAAEENASAEEEGEGADDAAQEGVTVENADGEVNAALGFDFSDTLITHDSFHTASNAGYDDYMTVFYGMTTDILKGIYMETVFYRFTGVTQAQAETLTIDDIYPGLGSYDFIDRVVQTDSSGNVHFIVRFRYLDNPSNLLVMHNYGLIYLDYPDGRHVVDAQIFMQSIEDAGAEKVSIMDIGSLELYYKYED